MARRRVFGPRKSLGQRLLGTATAVLFAVALVLALLYVTLPWTSAVVIERALSAQGWGPASVKVARIDGRGLELHDIALANNAITVKRLALNYSLMELWRGRARELVIAGARIATRWGDTGLSIGPHPLTSAQGGAAPSLQIGRITLSDTVATLAVGQLTLTSAVSADLVADEDRWDGRVSVEARADTTAAPVAQFAWEGAVAPSDPAKWRSHGTLDLAAAGLAIADGTKLNAIGRLELTTGDGTMALTAPERIALDLDALPPPARAQLPTVLSQALADGLSLRLGGSHGGPALHWASTSTSLEQDVDADLAVNFGARSLHASVRGHSTGAGGAVPEMVSDGDLRVDLQSVPTPMGAVSGRVALTNFNGPLLAAEGHLTTDLTVRGAALPLAQAGAARLAGTGKLRVDGQTLSFEPADLSLVLDDAKTPAGVTLQGRTTVALAPDPAQPQTLAFVIGPEPTFTAGLSVAARAVTIGLPGTTDDPQTILLDLPRLRLEGYTTAAGGYDLSLNTKSGTLGHALADAQISLLLLRLQPNGTAGTAEIAFSRIFGKPPRVARAQAGGLKIRSDLKIATDKLELTAHLRSTRDADVGRVRVTMDLAERTGTAKVDVPQMKLGSSGIAARDLLGADSGLDVSGAVTASLVANWTPSGQTGSAHLNIADLTLATDSIAVAGLATDLNLTSLAPLKSTAPFQLQATKLTYGLPLDDLAVALNLPGDGTLAISGAHAGLAGGRLTLPTSTVPLGGAPTTVTLGVAGLDLAAVIAQAKVSDLAVSGHLSGNLPLRVGEGSSVVAGGRLNSDAPGFVRYRPAAPPAALAGAGAGDTVLKALQNFQYDSIEARVNGDPEKQLRITLAMKGKNPDLYEGYPISFTLNLAGPLGAVLKQGVAGYNIGSDVVERLRSGGGQAAPQAP